MFQAPVSPKISLGVRTPVSRSSTTEMNAIKVASIPSVLESIQSAKVITKIIAIIFSGSVALPSSSSCLFAHSLALGVSFTSGG